jgi:hypothetical protein
VKKRREYKKASAKIYAQNKEKKKKKIREKREKTSVHKQKHH